MQYFQLQDVSVPCNPGLCFCQRSHPLWRVIPRVARYFRNQWQQALILYRHQGKGEWAISQSSLHRLALAPGCHLREVCVVPVSVSVLSELGGSVVSEWGLFLR